MRIPALLLIICLTAVRTLQAQTPAATASVPAAAPALPSLVQVIVSAQDNDPFTPWQKTRPGFRAGYGIVVSNGLILTTENLIRNSTHIELRAPCTGEKIPARVQIADMEVDLALLTFADEKKAGIVTPIPLAAKPTVRGPVKFMQMDETLQVQEGDGRALQISMAELPSAPHASLMQSVLAEINVNGEGAGLLVNGSLAGLVLTFDQKTRVAGVVPVSVIRRFLEDAATPPYSGTASGGFSWTPLIDPAKRKFLNVLQDGRGVLVLACTPGTGAAEVLKPQDVITEFDGTALDNLGFYSDPEFGRLTLPYLMKGRHKPGDQVPLKIIRDKQELAVQLRLVKNNDDALLIPEDTKGQRNDYLVAGGFIIRELTGRYLRSHGADWQKVVDPRLTHYYAMSSSTPANPGDHVVILSSVLPDPINVGYQNYRNQVITEVNGKPVRNMDEVFSINDADGGIKSLKLKSMGVELVLDQDELKAANERVSRTFRIPALKGRRSDAPAK